MTTPYAIDGTLGIDVTEDITGVTTPKFAVGSRVRALPITADGDWRNPCLSRRTRPA